MSLGLLGLGAVRDETAAASKGGESSRMASFSIVIREFGKQNGCHKLVCLTFLYFFPSRSLVATVFFLGPGGLASHGHPTCRWLTVHSWVKTASSLQEGTSLAFIIRINPIITIIMIIICCCCCCCCCIMMMMMMMMMMVMVMVMMMVMMIILDPRSAWTPWISLTMLYLSNQLKLSSEFTFCGPRKGSMRQPGSSALVPFNFDPYRNGRPTGLTWSMQLGQLLHLRWRYLCD